MLPLLLEAANLPEWARATSQRPARRAQPTTTRSRMGEVMPYHSLRGTPAAVLKVTTFGEAFMVTVIDRGEQGAAPVPAAR